MNNRVMSPTSKGQVTIPVEIRRRLKIDSQTMLQFDLRDNQIIITPVKIQEDNIRQFSQRRIDEWLENDKISPKDVAFFKKLLKK